MIAHECRCEMLTPDWDRPFARHHRACPMSTPEREPVARDEATLVDWIRMTCARELGLTPVYPFFYLDYNPGETSDAALLRLFRETRVYHRSDFDAVLCMCHG